MNEQTPALIEVALAALEDLPIPVAVTNECGLTTYANQAWHVFFGSPNEKGTGDAWLQAIHSEDREHFQTQFQTAFSGKLPYKIEYRLLHPDGTCRVLEETGQPRLGEGELCYLRTCQDITALRQAEAALAESEERFRISSLHTSDILVEWIPQKDEFRSLSHFDNLLGFEAGEVQKNFDSILELIHPDDRERVKAAIARSMESRQPFEEEYRIRHKKGEYLTWLGRGMFIYDPAGQPCKFLGAATDISAQKRAEAAIRASEARFHSILGNSLDLVYRRNLVEGRYEYLSPVAERIIGFSMKEMNAMTFAEILDRIHPDDRPVVASQLKQRETDGANKCIYRFKTGSGAYRWFSDYTYTQFDGEGKPLYRDGILRDVTELKEAELAVQMSEQRYRTLFEESPVSMWEEDFSEVKAELEELKANGITDFRTYFEQHLDHLARCNAKIRVLDVNRAAKTLYGAKDKEELLHNFQTIIDPTRLETSRELFTAIANGKRQFRMQVIEQGLDGSRAFVDTHWVVVPGYEESYARVLVCGVDISELKQLEMGIRRSAERSASLAHVAEIIIASHDLNRVLETVCAELGWALHFPMTAILLLDEKREVLHPCAAFGIPEAVFDRIHDIPRHAYDALEQEYGTLSAISDLSQASPLAFSVFRTDLGIRALAGTGIFFDEKLVGVLIAGSFDESQKIGAEEQDLLQAFANLSAVAIQNANLFHDLDHRARELETLATISSALRKAETLDEMKPIIVDQTRQIFAADDVTLLFLHGPKLEIAASSGQSQCRPDQDEISDPISRSVINGQGLFFSSPAEIDHFVSKSMPTSPLRLMRAESACALVPLKTTRSSIGLFHLGYQSPHLFSDAEKRLLTALSEMLSNAIQRAMIMDTLEHRVTDRTRDLEALYQIASIASGGLSLEEILYESLKIILPSVGATCGVIHLAGSEEELFNPAGYDGSEESILHLAAQLNLPEGFESAIQCFSPGDGLTGRTLLLDKALVIPDVGSDPRAAYPRFFTDNPMSFIGIPIHRSEKVVGVMSIYGRTEWVISAEDIALLTTISDQLGVVIENAALHYRAELGAVAAERQRLARELHDSITQVLYSLSLFAGAGQNLAMEGEREKLRAYFAKIESSSQQAIKEMRLLIYELRPSLLETEGLPAALRHRLEAVEGKAGIEHELVVQGELNIPKQMEIELYRIAHEALNNALKHAKNSQVSVRLAAEADAFVMEIRDNGQGFDPLHAQGGGLGLQTMQERARKIEGKFVLSSSRKGTRVKVEVKR